MRSEFIDGIRANQAAFGCSLTDEAIERLADYYDLVQEHNEILHLVGPSSPEEFAIRHILESLVLLEYLPTGAKFADVGAGAGLPSIPCLLVRDDLHAVLIESKEKKTKFLKAALNGLNLGSRARVVTRQFQEVDPGDCGSITCRALDKFSEKLPRLVKWSMKRRLQLFGGINLRDPLKKAGVRFEERLLPMSDQRYLFTSHP